VLGGPEDPEGEIEKTLSFIRRLKRLHPTCEIILYFYSPTPQIDRAALRSHPAKRTCRVLKSYGPIRAALPTTPEEWTRPRWVSWVCHQDAPWLTPRAATARARLRARARLPFPTVQDHRTPAWGKTLLRNLARWRYATGSYGRPIELAIGQRCWARAIRAAKASENQLRNLRGSELRDELRGKPRSADAIDRPLRASPRVGGQPGSSMWWPPSSLLLLSLHAIGASAIETPRSNKRDQLFESSCHVSPPPATQHTIR
jgi:hypothetical protein